jgi:hypothetical protein
LLSQLPLLLLEKTRTKRKVSKQDRYGYSFKKHGERLSGLKLCPKIHRLAEEGLKNGLSVDRAIERADD